MAVHDQAGCRGERAWRCACRLDRYGALDAAVDGAKSRPWSKPEAFEAS